jgi:hypothetical protein
MRTLRLFGSLIVVGYLAVVAGTIAWIVAFDVYHSWSSLVSEIAMAIAYGLVGFGCWRSVRACREDDASAKVIRGLTRWVGAASGAMAIAFASQTYMYHKTHMSFVAFGVREPHYNLQIDGGLAFVVGFLLAAVGLWFASSTPRVATEPGLTAISDASMSSPASDASPI